MRTESERKIRSSLYDDTETSLMKYFYAISDSEKGCNFLSFFQDMKNVFAGCACMSCFYKFDSNESKNHDMEE